MVATVNNDPYRALLNLHALLRDIDRFRKRDVIDSTFRDRLSCVQAEFSRMVGAITAEETLDGVCERLEELARAVRDFSPGYSFPDAATLRREWLRFRKQVGPFYEACAHVLRHKRAVHVPSLRPTNYARSAVHLTAGIAALAVLEFVLPMWILPFITGVMGATCWTLEIIRRKSVQFNRKIFAFFKPIAHPREAHHVNSATWFTTALFALSIAQSALIGAIAIAVLAIADPAAGVIGRRWGRITTVNGRSLEGSVTFFLVAASVSSLVIYLFHPEASIWPINIILSISAGFFGTLAELFSKHLDDNLTIPIATGSATLVAGLICQVALWG